MQALTHVPVRRRAHGVNVPTGERAASAAAGAALVGAAAKTHGVVRAALAATGAYLIGRGATGRCVAYRARALGREVTARRSITVLAPRSEVFRVCSEWLAEREAEIELRDAPGERGTEIHVTMKVKPALIALPARGAIERVTAHQIDRELLELRQLIETGEIARGGLR